MIWAATQENLSSWVCEQHGLISAFVGGFANNTGEDQPAHLGSLISAFVIRFLESYICKLAEGEISIL